MKFINCNYEEHGNDILEIFNEEIVNSTALYEYQPRQLESMVDWFKDRELGNFPVIGAIDRSNRLLGFATYGTFRNRPAYKYSIEHSVYIHKDHRRKGIAFALMQQLIIAATQQEYHTMIGGIDLGNLSSIALHEKLGFVHAGTIKQSGFKFGRWLDLGFYQLLLETPRDPVDS